MFKQIKSLFVVALLLGLCVTTYAQNTITHIVKRGETISSIAKKYGTTEESIKKKNPNVSNFLYAGMKLDIEQTASKSDVVEYEANDTLLEAISSERKTVYVNANEGEDMYSKWTFSCEIGFGFLDPGDNSSASAFEATLGANYFFSHLYCGARVGYLGADYFNRAGDTYVNYLAFPTEVGYAFGNNKIALVPYGGLNFDLGLNGKYESKDEGTRKINISGDLGVSLRLGLRVRIFAFNLSAAYTIPLNDDQKKINEEPYFAVSFAFGF